LAAQDDWRARLRRRLAATSDRPPRPLAPLELPAGAGHLLDQRLLAGLRPAAVLVPVVARREEPRVLLTVRTHRMRNHAGQISFPGGSAGPGDRGPVDTALRESAEEIALDPGHVQVAGYLDDYPTVTGFRVTPVVGLLEGEIEVNPDGIEVAEIFEVPLAFVLDADNYEKRHLERGGMKLPYWALAYGERFIWGATAGMLRDLMRKLTNET
jgi:8-oxo-dGTP pyrophosphatase MutT (NUDIX family)